MISAPHFDHQATPLSPVSLPADVFGVSAPTSLLAQALRVYQDRQHQHTHKVKTRGEVSLTTAKWYKQKGTGRARHGAQSAPLFVGGGVAHGPKGLRPAPKKLPQKMIRLSLKAVLSQLAKDKKIIVLSGLDKLPAKTKTLNDLLKKLNLSRKILLLTAVPYPSLQRASSNLNFLISVPFSTIDPLRLTATNHLLLDKNSIASLQSWLAPQKTAPKLTEDAKKETKTKTKQLKTKKQ